MLKIADQGKSGFYVVFTISLRACEINQNNFAF